MDTSHISPEPLPRRVLVALEKAQGMSQQEWEASLSNYEQEKKDALDTLDALEEWALTVHEDDLPIITITEYATTLRRYIEEH